jgi:hypothetical protein
VAFIGDLQPLSPEVLIPVQENCSILQGERHSVLDSGGGHGTKQSGDRFQKDDGVDCQVRIVLHEALNPQLRVAATGATEGKDHHSRAAAVRRSNIEPFSGKRPTGERRQDVAGLQIGLASLRGRMRREQE